MMYLATHAEEAYLYFQSLWNTNIFFSIFSNNINMYWIFLLEELLDIPSAERLWVPTFIYDKQYIV